MPICGSVLYIAAHPDDENTRLISYLTNELHYRTAYLSLTRGDGGQNLIGNEQSEQLGLIRTYELLAARKIDGGEQYFSRAFDFGYSKTPDETFRFWDKEKVLADAVWVIRNFRPDVIICRFPTTGEGGHGHHTASAIIAEEAFEAAADMRRFPEQLKHVQTWQAKRLLWNTFSFGNRNTTSPDQFKIDVGGFNTLLGKSYGEIAAESRSCHSSQAFGTARNRASQLEYFKTIKGSEPKNSLMDDVNTGISRFAPKWVEEKTKAIVASFNHRKPHESIPALLDLHQQIQQSITSDEPMKNFKLKQMQELIFKCAGFFAEAVCSKQYAALGDTLSLSVNLINRSPERIAVKRISIAGKTFASDSSLPAGKPFTWNETISIPENDAISQPYWLRAPTQRGMFTVNEQTLIGKAQNDASIEATVELDVKGRKFILQLPVQFKKVDPAKGEIYQPLYIAPPATASFLKEVNVLHSGNKKQVELKLKAFKKDVSGLVSLELPLGWKSSPPKVSFNLANDGDEQIVSFEIEAPAKRKHDTTYLITASLNISGKSHQSSFVEINYNHVPVLPLFSDAVTKLTDVPLQNTSRNIGYISGAGDKLPALLQEMGLNVREVTDEDVLQKRLQNFDAIVVGVRAFNTEMRLKNQAKELMSYLQHGGRLLVQYNTNQRLVTEQLGPYPFKISRSRVTEEDADVEFLSPSSPLLNQPNIITKKDFDGWVQERGLYFPESLDGNYRTLLRMKDSGEDSNDNALIYCDYGSGKYVYTGLSFFRQLPAGVPGAYKLFSNLIAR